MAIEDPNVIEWRTNIKSRATEVSRLIDGALTNLSSTPVNPGFLETCTKVTDRINDTLRMYAVDQRPQSLIDLRSKVANWRENPGNAEFIKGVVQGSAQLANLNAGDNSKPTFSKIFSEYAKDQELADLIKELCGQIREILEKGKDEIAETIAGELRSILVEIEKNQGKPLVEMDPWLQFLISTLGVIGGSYTHGALPALAAGAIILAVRSKHRIFKLYDEAVEKLVECRSFRHAVRLPATSPLYKLEDSEEIIKVFKEGPFLLNDHSK